MASRKEQERENRLRVKKLRWVVEEFLEGDFKPDDLNSSKDQALIQELAIGLRQNFIADDDRHPFSPSPERRVTAYYNILKPVWEQLKKAIAAFKNDGVQRKGIPYKKSEVLNHEPPFWVNPLPTISVNAENGRLNLSTDRVNALLQFMELLQGLPVEIFAQCGASDCDRWIIKTRKNRINCSNQCASRANQRDLRQNPARKTEYLKVRHRRSENRNQKRK